MPASAAQAVLASWRLEPAITVGLLAAAWLYVRGWRRLRPLRVTLFPPWRLVAFLGGVGTTWLALASPIDAFGGLLLSAHMVQHLLLIAVAPPLILLGAPMVPLLRGLPPPIARDALNPFLTWPLLRRCLTVLTHPVWTGCDDCRNLGRGTHRRCTSWHSALTSGIEWSTRPASSGCARGAGH